MAQPLHSFVLISFFLAHSFNVAFSSEHDYPGLKSLHFTLYEQETLNKTAYMIIKGVDTGVQATTQVIGPFGTLYAFHDPLTTKVNRSSKVVGAIEGTAVVSTQDRLQTINLMTITLSLKNQKGSISVVGAAPVASPGDFIVVGGTGDFMFVQGYLTLTPIDLTLPVLTFKNEFHLYWPPYAAYKSNV